MARTRVSCYPNAGLPNEELQVSRDAGVVRRAARTLRRPRLAQSRRRLLRHDARAHQGDRGDGGRQAAANGARRVARRTYYSGIDLVEGDESQPPADRRRAHQRHRLAGCSRTWSPKRSGKRRPRSRAGRCETAPTSSTSACSRASATRRRTSRTFYEKLIAQGQGAADDRHHRPEGDRAGAHLLPGQEPHQLDQPRGRRREVRARRARWRAATARRWWSAASTKTSCRRRPSRASASSPSPSGASSC